jgi:glycosyltransferase involved in cell wall biosynthesis
MMSRMFKTTEDRPLIVGFLKVREANLVRCLANLRQFCDTIVACDDASSDGTRQILQAEIPAAQLLLVPPEEHDFRAELAVKQRMLTLVDPLKPRWIWWADADEELEPDAFDWIRATAEREKVNPHIHGYRFPYLQLWRTKEWIRVDDGFADGSFVKLWKWSPRMKFVEEYGTHHQQFPTEIQIGKVQHAPHRVVHWGNYGKNLVFKAIQYHGGLGGVDRHLNFEAGAFKRTPRAALGLAPLPPEPKIEIKPEDILPVEPKIEIKPEDIVDGIAWPFVPLVISEPAAPLPKPFTKKEKEIILSLRGLRNEPGMFTVIIPAYNRAWALPETLQSLIAQTYTRWVAVVLDDGSTDDSFDVMKDWQHRDPRIFYARYNKVGAVALNEIGMDIASSWTSWWTRLGSDDYFEPHKLALDALALSAGAELTYGPYRALRDGKLAETCNQPRGSQEVKQILLNGGFYLSWANIACSSELLRRVKAYYGNYCDPRLKTMEDFLVNARLVRFADPVFRARIGQMTVLDPGPGDLEGMRNEFLHDAIWRVNSVGASADTVTTGSEDGLTREIILAENASWKPQEPEATTL